MKSLRSRERSYSIPLKRRRSQNQSEHLGLAFVRVNSLTRGVIVQRFQFGLRPGAPDEMREQLRRGGAPDRVYQSLRLDLRRRNPIRRNRQSEIPSPQQRAEPRRGLIRITVRRRMLKRRLPHPQQIFDEWFVGVRIGARRAQATGDKMKWPFEFDSARGFEFA